LRTNPFDQISKATLLKVVKKDPEAIVKAIINEKRRRQIVAQDVGRASKRLCAEGTYLRLNKQQPMLEIPIYEPVRIESQDQSPSPSPSRPAAAAAAAAGTVDSGEAIKRKKKSPKKSTK